MHVPSRVDGALRFLIRGPDPRNRIHETPSPEPLMQKTIHNIYIYIYIYMYVCMYVCMYIYIYIYMCVS